MSMNLRKHEKSNEFPSWIHIYTENDMGLVDIHRKDINMLAPIYAVNITLKLFAQLQFFKANNIFYGNWTLLRNYVYLNSLDDDSNSFTITDAKNFGEEVHTFIINDINNPKYEQIAFTSSKTLEKTLSYMTARYNLWE